LLRSGASVQNGIAGSAISSLKSTLRKRLRTLRRSLDAADHARRSGLATAAIKRLPAFKCGARIAIYLPFDRETHTAALVADAQRRGVHLYVPVVSDLRHRRLRFYPLSGGTHPGVFGIAVPRRRGKAVEPRWFHCIIVPLVGIDGAGRRLGVGGGFYDRALAFRRLRRHWRGPRLIGLGFECQRVADVHADPWDVRLDALATESGVHHFPKAAQ